MAANASSNGAKTVKGPAPFRFSFKPDLERVSFNLLKYPKVYQPIMQNN